MKKADRTGKWIWFPGDFERMLANKCSCRRYERDVFIPPFWRMDSHYISVKFVREITLTKTNNIRIECEGRFNIYIGQAGGYIHDFNGILTLPAGTYTIEILVFNDAGLPCVRVNGDEFVSDGGFLVTCKDGDVHNAVFNDIIGGASPNAFVLPTEEVAFVSCTPYGEGKLYDFGREIVAFLKFSGVSGPGSIDCYYGESRGEACDKEHSLQTDKVRITKRGSYTTAITKAFRYVYVISPVRFTVSALSEYLPLDNRAVFITGDKRLQDIWDASVYTLRLCGREFFFDGVKRDRWVWSGDASQCYLMNYYTFFDLDIVRRTTVALMGHKPVSTHINHVMDYTFFWITGLYDYYMYTGDSAFIEKWYGFAEEYMNFCAGRVNEEGFMCERPFDWIFIDWADMDNSGETSFEQILYLRAMEVMKELGGLLGKDVSAYRSGFEKLLKKINEVFWDEERGCYTHSRKDGKITEKITRYTNIFAILFNFCDGAKKDKIVKNVLLNENVQKIHTPYMRFYELAVLCEIGCHEYVINEIRNYWGGMLDEGASTFWEHYDPEVKDAKKFEMYDRPFGKSLCHAWGASPVYLIGKYFLGLKPSEAGYKSFELRPQVDALTDFQAVLPANGGEIRISCKSGELKILSSSAPGTAYIGAAAARILPGKEYVFQTGGEKL